MYNEANQEAASQLELQHQHRIVNPSDAPLVYLVHGRAGSVSSMAPFRRCIPKEFNVIQPQAPFEDSEGGWSWWNIAATKEENLNGALEAVDILEHFIESSIGYYHLKPKKLIGVGFSQGGVTLSLISQKRPVFLDAIALLASFAFWHPNSKLPDAEKLPKIFAAHGSNDEIVPLSRNELSLKPFYDAGAEVQKFIDPVGHKVGTQGMRALLPWLESLV